MTTTPSPTPDEGQLLDWTPYGVPPCVEVRAFNMGMIQFKDGKAQALIDTTGMTREEVVRSIAVALTQIDIIKAGEGGSGNRKTRRARVAEAKRVIN